MIFYHISSSPICDKMSRAQSAVPARCRQFASIKDTQSVFEENEFFYRDVIYPDLVVYDHWFHVFNGDEVVPHCDGFIKV